MDHNNIIECGGFYFIHSFDSGNLGHVERVPTELIAPTINPKTNVAECPDYEFNMWTRPDCAGTEFENGNRTWFYFGIQAREPNVTVRLNLINLNKQGKMYNQGMAPVTRTLPGKPQWERIRDPPVHSMDDNTFTLSFKYRTSDNLKATTFFAFTYPFSFAELQIALNSIDLKMLPTPTSPAADDIYYCRECLIYSLEGRRVDLLTISSHHGITTEREERLKNLFPDNKPRAFKFQNKKVIFISARVHPGETPSSFVFNGFLHLLLSRHDPIAIQLRKLYVFKMIPFLNPDGVARGHYRTDTRGVNLNRVYLNPSLIYHPTVYASRALIRYYHFGCEKEDTLEDSKSFPGSKSIQNLNDSDIIDMKKKKSPPYKSKPVSNKSSTTIKPPRPLSTEAGKQNAGEPQPSIELVDSKKSPPRKPAASAPKSAGLRRPREAKVPLPSAKPQCSGDDKLIDQVCDVKLDGLTSTKSESQASPRRSASPSLLHDDVLRTCLGSDVHLSTSEELKIQGTNPLLPLRDALKNSISLLLGSPPTTTDTSHKESNNSNVRMGWCDECRRALDQLQESMPGLATTIAGYSSNMESSLFVQSHSRTLCTSIDEYREHQKQRLDEKEALKKKLQDTEQAEKGESMYFCTNCFKRYILTQNNEEIKLCSGVTTTSVSVSTGEGDVTAARPPAAGEMATQTLPLSPKDEKTKTPLVRNNRKKLPAVPSKPKEPESGLFLYIDLHGHASKKGIFMYGNHFEDAESSVECMLLPRIMSLNNMHFHFSSCNFTERNMYLKDRRDGMSREGSGRVAVLKATGLVRSYTLECNYNTGRLVNVLPPPVRELCPPASHASHASHAPPPKYTPHIFEEVGRSLGSSILDLTGQHPNSRVPCSEHRNLGAVRDWLRAHTRTLRPTLTMSRLRPKTSSPTRAPLYARSKAKVVDVERKENTYAGAKVDSRGGGGGSSGGGAEAAGGAGAARFPPDEAKAKPMASKRRQVLALRKPNASKTHVQVAAKSKSRRSADGGESPRSVLAKIGSKRSFRRARCLAPAASSSSDSGGGLRGWEDAPLPSGKRRVGGFAPPQQLKKLRLKTGL